MSSGKSVLDAYKQQKPAETSLVAGRFLFCMNCEGFTRHAIFMDGDEKIIGCRKCGSEQARLVQWRKDDWVDRRYTDNLALTVLNILGEKFIADLFIPDLPEDED